MKCNYCQSELPEEAVLCPHCGRPQEEAAQASPEEAAVQELPSEEEIVPAEVPEEALPESPACVQPPKNKKKLWIILGAAALAVLIAASAVLIYLGGADGRTLKQAQELADSEEYEQALDLLDTIEDPSSDIRKEMKTLKSEIYDAIDSEVTRLLQNESAQKALDYLNEYDFIPNYGSLLSEIYERMEDDIYALMDEGEYIDAQALLLEYSFLPNYETLGLQIKYETFIIQCAFDLRPMMKNPSSLQVNSVEFYNTDADYPTVVINESGQNGFGGYSTGYVLFDDDDLTYIGSVSSLDTSDLDDYVDKMIAFLILAYRSNEDYAVTDAVFDLSRINSFLPSGKMPNIDITQYASSASTDEGI